jgi:hypothetical protein
MAVLSKGEMTVARQNAFLYIIDNSHWHENPGIDVHVIFDDEDNRDGRYSKIGLTQDGVDVYKKELENLGFTVIYTQ